MLLVLLAQLVHKEKEVLLAQRVRLVLLVLEA